MSKNDATPTWSGFNYQGKIMLLSILLEINKLLSSNTALDDCYVEIEKIEDFIIYINNKIVSLNQVKAYLSTQKVSSFSGAMQKLLDHRAEKGELSAECVLCCPLQISDWRDSTNTYYKQINLFNYDNQFVHVVDVPKYIKQELTKTLNYLKLSTIHMNALYLGLCELLHNKLSDMHKQGTKNRNYNLCFTDITNFLTQSHNNYVEREELRNREQVYTYISCNFNTIIDDYCNNRCSDKKNAICKLDISGACSIKTAYDYILNIDIWKYTRYLRPDIIDKWENPLSYVERLNSDAIAHLLIPVLHRIQNNSLQTSNDFIYCNTNIYKTAREIVIPTLLSFQAEDFDDDDDIKNSISSKLENIKKNSYLASSIVAGSTITAKTGDNQYSTKEDCIFYNANNERANAVADSTHNSVKIADSKEFITLLKG